MYTPGSREEPVVVTRVIKITLYCEEECWLLSVRIEYAMDLAPRCIARKSSSFRSRNFSFEVLIVNAVAPVLELSVACNTSMLARFQ